MAGIDGGRRVPLVLAAGLRTRVLQTPRRSQAARAARIDGRNNVWGHDQFLTLGNTDGRGGWVLGCDLERA